MIGKMLTSIGYALAVTVGSQVLGLVTVNLLVPDEGWLWYPQATLAGSLAADFLGATLIAATMARFQRSRLVIA